MQTAEKISTLELVKEREIRRKNFWAVIFHNDDVTTMEFVVWALKKFFNKSEEEAVSLMYRVHLKGKAKVAVYPKEIAETKVEMVQQAARSNNFPLRVTMEEETK